MGIAKGISGSTGGGSLPVAPGNPQILSVSVIDAVPDTSGVPKKQITITYEPPSPLGTFQGADAYLDAPDTSGGLSIADGTVPEDGNTPAIGVFSPQYEGFIAYNANNLQYTFTVPAPTQTQLWRIYLTPASANVQAVPIQYGQTGASPSFQFTVLPPATGGQGVEYAPNVQSMELAAVPSGWTANPNLVVAASGDQYWEVSVSWNWPTSDPQFSSLGGVNIILQNNTTGTQSYPGNVSVSAAGLYTSIHLPIAPGTTSYTLFAISYDVNGNSNTLLPGVTPSVSFTVTAPVGPVGEEYCALVSPDGVHNLVVVTPVNGADGTQLLQVDGYWLNLTSSSPNYDPRFGGAQVVIDKGDGNGPIWSAVKGTLSPIEADISQPAAAQGWAFYIRSIDINGRGNTVTPLISFSGGGGSGAVYTPIITNGVLTACTGLEGGTGYTSAPTATLVDSTGAAIPGVSLTAHLTGTAVSSVTINAGGSGIIATPVIVLSVGNATGVLNLAKAASTSFSTQFSIVAGAFTVAALNANVITAGTIKVGNNGSGVPIEIDVYDHLGNLIGWIGDDTANSGYVGGWFKQLRVGGASPAAAPIYCDTSGNVYINGATFVLDSNGVTTTLSNQSLFGSYAGVTVALNGTSTEAYVLPNEIGLVNSGGHQVVRLFPASTNGPGEISLNLANGSSDTYLQAGVSGGTIAQLGIGTGTGTGVIYIGADQVLTTRQTGPGTPSFTTFAQVQSWCQALYTALQTHGLVS